MKVLVTGGAGFIGSHLVEKLIEQNHQPVVLDNLSTGKKINLPKQVKLYQLDLNSSKLGEVFKKEKIKAVCHLAAATNVRKSIQYPLIDIRNNVLGMVNLLENCKNYKIKRFVFSSTGGALYGDTSVLPTSETHLTYPISPYGVDKLSGENYLFYYNQIYKIPVTILRYSNIYGPRQDRKGEGGVVVIFIQHLINQKPVTINGTGRQTRDFVYVKDIARANLLALENSVNQFAVYNIGQGQEISVNQLYSVLSKKLGIKIKPNHGLKIKGEIKRSCLNSNKAWSGIGWRPEFNLEQGIEQTINYFKKKI